MIVYFLIFIASPLLFWPLGSAIGRWLDGRWTKVYWVFGLLLVVVNFGIWNSPPSKGDIFGLGALLSFWLALATIIFLTASTWSRLPADPLPPAIEGRRSVQPGRRGWRLDASDVAFGLLLGGAFPLVFLVWFGILARMPGLPVTSVLALLAALMLLLFATGRRQSAYVNASCLILSITLSGLLVQGYADSRAVVSAARAIAAGADFCIQSGRKQVDGLYDLSRITLREPRSPNGYLRNHALLVIARHDGQAVLNWSYKARSFVDDISPRRLVGNSAPEIICVPKPGGGLPVI